MDKVAVVTGASSGLGVDLARDLAGRGYSLVLVARSEAQLREVAREIGERHKVRVWTEALDLAVPGSADELVSRLDALQISPTVLVSNAAANYFGPFIQHDAAKLRDMLNLNVVTATELTHALGRRMAERGAGHILLVGSMAAYTPSPKFAVYGAAKAYLLSLGEALNIELGPKVTTTVLSPGLMDTGFNAAAGFQVPDAARRTMVVTEEVAKVGLDTLFAGKPSVVPGRINRTILNVGSLFTRNFRARHMGA